jgi:hypothetical protein
MGTWAAKEGSKKCAFTNKAKSGGTNSIFAAIGFGRGGYNARMRRRIVAGLVNAWWLLLVLAVSELIWLLLRAWAIHLRATL